MRVQGEAEGHPYDADGWFHANAADQRLEWGSDGERQYKGWMDIAPQGQSSKVTVHLSFDPNQVMDSQSGRDAKINEGLEAALQSIKNHVEGQGGKVEPSAAT